MRPRILRLMPPASLRWLALSVLFLICFCAPLIAGLQYTGIIHGSFPFFDDDREHGEYIPQATIVSQQGTYVRIGNSAQLAPQDGQDLVVVAWFNLRRLPPPGQRLILLSKYQGSERPRNGYALALNRADDGALRASVYWGDSSNSARWYDFPELNLATRSWFAMILSFRDSRFMGLHLAQQSGHGPAESTLQGGYDLGPESGKLMGNGDLVSGASAERMFRGEIGPIGIISAKGLGLNLGPLLKALTSHPALKPEIVDQRDVRLWFADARSDSSQYSHRIEVFSRQQSRLKNEEEP